MIVRLSESLFAEIRENVRRSGENVAALKQLLYHLGDAPDAAYPDWDWRWPTSITLEPAVHKCFDDPRWLQSAPTELRDKLTNLYDLFFDQPPNMEQWAEEWRGEQNLFYVFVFRKLDQHLAEIRITAADVQDFIHAMLPA